MVKTWVFADDDQNDRVDELAKVLNVSNSIARILYRRGIVDFNSARSFFRPTLDHLHDPFLMQDLGKAVNRLGEAIFQGDQILIYGDYDVDGTTSVALLYKFLSKFSDKLECYIPDRYTEGYGISEKGVRHAHSSGAKLMIALDCGIRAIEQAQLAKSLGVDLIICDHHLPGDSLPGAFAVLDPKRQDCQYPYKELSGCGVGFKLLQGFCIQNTIPLIQLYELLDLLVVSIAADIVPVTGENRVLAFYGMRRLNESPAVGIGALKDIVGFKGRMTITNVVFGIAPRINAAGRIGHALEAVKLLISESQEEADQIASKINDQNIERKDLDKQITEEAIQMIEAQENECDLFTTVLYKEEWHKGVIGIVASRCIEKYYKPTIILTSSNGMITGSARSVKGFDIHTAIAQCGDLLEQYGGHKYAAGLTLKPENLEGFREEFEKTVKTHITEEQTQVKLLVDAEVALSDLTFKFHNVLEQMAPFGPANMKPVFVTRNLKIKGIPRLLKEEHIKMTLLDMDANKNIDAIAFGFGEIYENLLQAESVDVAYYLEINEYMGNKSLQLMVKDIKLN